MVSQVSLLFVHVWSIPHDNAENNNNPAERATHALTKLEVCLNHHEHHCAPKDNLQCVENNIGLEA